MMRSVISVIIKEGEMGEARSTHRSYEKCKQNLVGKLNGRDYWEDLSIDGRKIVEWILRK
jgi:hypothetical protein